MNTGSMSAGPANAGQRAVADGHAGHPVRRWLVAAALLLVIVVGGWLVAFSSVLGVRSVTVTGTHQLSPAQVTAAAAIRPGTPLSRLDTAAVRARVAALPDVRTVIVRTAYPSTVTIQVTERVPVGYRTVPAGAEPAGAVLVDASNVQFRTVPKAPAALPQLELAGDPACASATATVAGSLPARLARRVALIAAPTTESITLTLRDGRTVLWGGTDRSADKAKLVTALIGRPGSYFDVSDPSSVISRGA